MAAVESAATVRPSSTIAWKSCCTIFHYVPGPCRRQGVVGNIVLDRCATTGRVESVHRDPPAVLTVTLNFARDVTYGVDRVAWHGANRVASVAERAGGKGVKVARVVRALGHRPVVSGLVGGRTGAAARDHLRRA